MTRKAYVIKSWNVNVKPDSNGSYITIVGRMAGLISYLLSICGIDPTVTLRVNSKNLFFTEGSLAGTKHNVIPLRNISSVLYGYHKPWQAMLVLLALGASLAFCLGNAAESGIVAFVVFAIFTVIALAYYALSKKLIIGVIGFGSETFQVVFKRSVIEGKNIDEENAKYVGQVLQSLMDMQYTHKSS